MKVTYDPDKDALNRRKHGISLAKAAEFDFDSAEFRTDDREDYGEPRYISVGFLGGDLYTLVYTLRRSGVRAISLRRATRAEKESYAEQH